MPATSLPSLPEIEGLLDKTRRALGALAAKRKAAQRKISDLLATGQDKLARAEAEAADTLSGDIAFEETRLAALEQRRAEAEAADASAARVEQMRQITALAANRVAAADKIDAAVASLGKAVASITAMSGELDRLARAVPGDARLRAFRTDGDVFPGLAASLIKSGLPHLFPNVEPGTGDMRTLGQRAAATHAFLTSLKD